jgi:hypothetical protein
MRRPLAWLILLEVVVVAALAATTYHLVTTRTATANAAPPVVHAAVPKPRPPTPAAAPPPAAPAPTPHPLGPPPGLNFDPAFWSGQLHRINQDQHLLEQLQWRLTAAVTDWIRAYVNQVLIPAVEQAERR